MVWTCFNRQRQQFGEQCVTLEAEGARQKVGLEKQRSCIQGYE